MASLYLHIPFCERKCLYCDFYSIENLDPMESFLEALDREIGMSGSSWKAETFDTVFYGGGTPSLLTPAQLERIQSRLHSTFTIAPDAEITLETNPGTVTPAKLTAYRALGINRLSIGVQSFREEELKFLSRIHDAAQGRACVAMARQAGFDNVSLDLIFSLPGQLPEDWELTLHQALELEPDHISAYSLIVEDNTPLARMVAARQVSPNPLEAEAALYERTMELMEQHGFEHYEVSNYARPGRRSRHNSAYWTHVNYLSFGPSGHSFRVKEAWTSASRWANVANISTYIERLTRGEAPVASRENLGIHQLMNERIFLGLRSDGVDLGRFAADFGTEFPAAKGVLLRELITHGKGVLDGPVFRLTSEGFLVCDEIAQLLMI